MEIITWPVVQFVPYRRNLRKNHHAVERMAPSIQQFGFKIPVLARSDGTVVDGHLRLKATQKLGTAEVPVILCDELECDGRSLIDIAAERCPARAEA